MKQKGEDGKGAGQTLLTNIDQGFTVVCDATADGINPGTCNDSDTQKADVQIGSNGIGEGHYP